MFRVVCLAALTAAVTAPAAPVPKAVKEQRPKLDGTWEVTEQHSRGNRVNVTTTTTRWTIDGESLTIQRTNAKGVALKPAAITYTLVVPDDGDGNALDYVLTYNNGTTPTRTYPGVFEVDGDTLKFCYLPTTAKAGTAARPTECKPDQSNILYVFKRVEADK
jgi:uncharacterized protein (TIGR03067 family)